jgi:multidrug resistance efflux pump
MRDMNGPSSSAAPREPGSGPAKNAADASPSASAQPAAPHWQPPQRGKAATCAIGCAALAAILAVLYASRLWPFAGLDESTDNAYVRGRTTFVSPQVSGYVTSVRARDFAAVKAGRLLVTIDDRTYRARVAQARANLDAARVQLANSLQAERSRSVATERQDATLANAHAQLERTQLDMGRANALVDDGSISLRERDQTRAQLLAAQAAVREVKAGRAIGTQDLRKVIVGRDALKAEVEGAQAQLQLAQVDLDNTLIRAPSDGQLSEFDGHVEQLAPATGSEFAVLKPAMPLATS